MTGTPRQHVALVPSPLPAIAAARERVLADLRAAAVQVREDSLAGGADDRARAAADSPARRLMFLDPGPSPEPIADTLSDPPAVDVMLELGADTPAERIAGWARRIAETDVFWSLSTMTAMRMATPSRAVAQTVMHALGPRGSDELLMRVETALHETLANALVHGNLELPSLCTLEGDDPAVDYDDAVAASLGDPALAGRRVEVSARCEPDLLRICVSDEGDGVPDTLWHQSLAGGQDALAHSDKSGRGLYLTAMFCEDLNRYDAGRTVELCFQPDGAG